MEEGASAEEVALSEEGTVEADTLAPDEQTEPEAESTAETKE